MQYMITPLSCIKCNVHVRYLHSCLLRMTKAHCARTYDNIGDDLFIPGALLRFIFYKKTARAVSRPYLIYKYVHYCSSFLRTTGFATDAPIRSLSLILLNNFSTAVKLSGPISPLGLIYEILEIISAISPALFA